MINNYLSFDSEVELMVRKALEHVTNNANNYATDYAAMYEILEYRGFDPYAYDEFVENESKGAFDTKVDIAMYKIKSETDLCETIGFGLVRANVECESDMVQELINNIYW